MKTKFIKGLNQIQSKYDTFFIDLWGVIHNGIQVYPGAIEVLENLNNLTFNQHMKSWTKLVEQSANLAMM